MYYQDDPKKCTAARMVRLGLAKSVSRPSPSGLVLSPFSNRFLLPKERSSVRTVVGVDCSWNLADRNLFGRLGGFKRRLPPLLAGNPINYAKLDKLTTAEAISAALFIMGFEGQARQLLERFKWGHTFYDLNRNLLYDYSKLNDEGQIQQILRDYNLL